MPEKIPFRKRGKEVTRLEAFSDVVFGFALTMIVVSLEVPRTFDEMARSMRGFLGFAICFAVLCWVWRQHYNFSSRYALEDIYTVFLNLVLLFVVLFYIYPLKFLFRILTGGGSWDEALRADQVVPLMVLYGVGFCGIWLLMALMYFHAYRMRDAIGLNEVEVHDTLTFLWMYVAYVGIGIISILIAVIGGPELAGIAGMFYGVIGPVSAVIGFVRGSARSALEERIVSRGGGIAPVAGASFPEPPAPATP